MEQRLRQKDDHQADQTDPVWIVLRVVVVARLHDADAGLPDELIVDSTDRWLVVVFKGSNREARLKEEH